MDWDTTPLPITYTSHSYGNYTDYDNSYGNYTDYENATKSTPPHLGSGLTTMRWVSEVGFNLPVSLLGVVGNLVAFTIMCGYKQSQSTTVYLQALALSDTVYLLLVFFLRSLQRVGVYRGVSSIAYAFRWLYPHTYTVRFFSTWITVLVTIDRYMAVRNPLLASRLGNKRKAYVQIAVTALVAMAFSLVRIFEINIVVDGGHVKAEYTPLMKNKAYSLIYRASAFFLVMYLVPLVMLICLNALLLRSLKRAEVDRNELQAHLTKSVSFTRMSSVLRTTSTTRIVVSIVIISICISTCAGTSHVLWSVVTCYSSTPHLHNVSRYLSQVSNILVVIGCTVNLVVYSVCSRKFRAAAIDTLRCYVARWRCGRFMQRSLRQQSQSSTCSGETRLTNISDRDITIHTKKRVNEKMLEATPDLAMLDNNILTTRLTGIKSDTDE